MRRTVVALGLAGAIVLPLTRRRLRVPAPATIGACLAGPAALASLPPSRRRDAAMFAAQMWAFAIVHELPYDDPERLRRRLGVRYPIALDRTLGAGTIPTLRLQRSLSGRRHSERLDAALSWLHWGWFLEPYLALGWVLARGEGDFGRAARQLALTFDLGCAAYFLVPTAPPWWASEQGLTGGRVRRIMAIRGERTWGAAWPALYRAAGDGNPWAAMPSLHFATALVVAMQLAESGDVAAALGWGYALALGFALVYLGEHYLTDIAAGALLAALARATSRWGEPRLAPLLARLEARNLGAPVSRG